MDSAVYTVRGGDRVEMIREREYGYSVGPRGLQKLSCQLVRGAKRMLCGYGGGGRICVTSGDFEHKGGGVRLAQAWEGYLDLCFASIAGYRACDGTNTWDWRARGLRDLSPVGCDLSSKQCVRQTSMAGSVVAEARAKWADGKGRSCGTEVWLVVGAAANDVIQGTARGTYAVEAQLICETGRPRALVGGEVLRVWGDYVSTVGVFWSSGSVMARAGDRMLRG
ncbi:hypothetical protein Tco_1143281 [Tanacetum coccineum]